MKLQKIISIITIIVSLSLIIYMCVVMSMDSGSSNSLPSPDNIVMHTPHASVGADSKASPTTSTESSPTALATLVPTMTIAPTQSPVTSVPGGKTSTNPNYIGKKIISITFDEKDVRETGRSAMGVKGISLSADDTVVGMQIAGAGPEYLFITEKGMGKRTRVEEFRPQNRGGKGIICYRLHQKLNSSMFYINTTFTSIRKNLPKSTG